jgi:cyclopropane-fatty-acyl-phospholipid synthase
LNTLAAPARAPRKWTPATGRLLCALLDRLDVGRVELTTPDGATLGFGPGGAPVVGGRTTPAVLALRDWHVAGEALRGGDVAFAESYMEGRWDTPDLTQLLTVLAANQSSLERAFYGHWWSRSLLRLKHFLNANTKRQARRNILAHYDLGNDFYRLWLDPSMTYSSALFGGRFEQPLLVAQQAKYARLLDELRLPPAGRILEIGCGWGGFAQTAARAGHHVTGISLSDAQTEYARSRLTGAGLADRADLRIQDYRDVREAYDGIASIEMFEAVGERWWPRISAPCATRSPRAAARASRRSRSPTRASSATGRSRTSSSSTSFRAACWPRPRGWSRPPASRAWSWSVRRRSAPTMRRR